MAAFQKRLGEIESAGAQLVGLSVDTPEKTEEFRHELGLEFTILADTDRTIVKGWDRFNRFEMGGVAKPTLFVVDAELRIRLRADGKPDSRYGVDQLVNFLNSDSRFADFDRGLPHRFLIRLGRIMGLAGYRTRISSKTNEQKGSVDG